jgi:ParB family chromosome partitioning protein
MTWGKKDSNSSSFKKAKRRPASGPKKWPKSKKAEKKMEPVGAAEQGRVRVRDVLVLPSHKVLDRDLVSSIAESFVLSGGRPFCPIAVRRLREEDDGKEVIKTVLVAGAHRLEAAKSAELEFIDCVYVEGDETDAKLIELGENIWRKTLTVLQHAEDLTDWAELALMKGYISGHIDQKSKLGRPPSGFSEFARKLPAVGRSYEACRKIMERARKIAHIAPQAKEAARTGGLDDNQKALLRIAKAGGPTEQVKKAKKLAACLQKALEPKKPGDDPKPEAKASDRQRDEPDNVIKSGPLQPDSEDTTDADEPEADKKADTPKPVEETTFEALEELWKREGRELWKYTPFGARELFIETLRRARCYAKADVGSFIRDIFWGRKDIDCEALYSFAKTRGLTKIVVRKALKELLYRRKKRRGSGSRGSMYYRNKDSEWEGQALKISDAELEAARAKHKEDRTLTLGVVDRDRKLDDYFSDIMEDPADTDDEKD